jgi:hypothetical protein
MDCALCQKLTLELSRFERIHAEKRQAVCGQTDSIRGYKHRVLRIAQNAALLDVEIARDKLNRHLREHQATLVSSRAYRRFVEGKLKCRWFR